MTRPIGTYLTPYEIAAELRVSKMTVYRLISDGSLPAIRVGRNYRVREGVLEAFLREQDTTSSAGWDA